MQLKPLDVQLHSSDRFMPPAHQLGDFVHPQGGQLDTPLVVAVFYVATACAVRPIEQTHTVSEQTRARTNAKPMVLHAATSVSVHTAV